MKLEVEEVVIVIVQLPAIEKKKMAEKRKKIKEDSRLRQSIVNRERCESGLRLSDGENGKGEGEGEVVDGWI